MKPPLVWIPEDVTCSHPIFFCPLIFADRLRLKPAAAQVDFIPYNWRRFPPVHSKRSQRAARQQRSSALHEACFRFAAASVSRITSVDPFGSPRNSGNFYLRPPRRDYPRENYKCWQNKSVSPPAFKSLKAITSK